MSLLVIGFAVLNLLDLDYSEFRSIFEAVQSIAELAIALMAMLIAAKECGGLFRRFTVVALVPFVLHRLFHFWIFRHADLPWFFHVLAVAPPIFLLALIATFPLENANCEFNSVLKRNSPSILLRLAIFCLACVMFGLAAFSFGTGLDILGGGLHSVVTSLLSLSGAISSMFYALDPLSRTRRVVAIGSVEVALAIRFCRAVSQYAFIRFMDSSGWFVLLIDFGPSVAILAVLMTYSSFRTKT